MGWLYTADDSGDTELVYRDDGGADTQLTRDGYGIPFLTDGALDISNIVVADAVWGVKTHSAVQLTGGPADSYLAPELVTSGDGGNLHVRGGQSVAGGGDGGDLELVGGAGAAGGYGGSLILKAGSGGSDFGDIFLGYDNGAQAARQIYSGHTSGDGLPWLHRGSLTLSKWLQLWVVSTPSAAANQGQLYCKYLSEALGSEAELHFQNTDYGEILVTEEGSVRGGLVPVTKITGGLYTTPYVNRRVPYDPSAGTVTLKPPASPTVGDRWGIKNVTTSATAVTIDGNGESIEDPVAGGAPAASFSLGIANVAVQWEFMNSASGNAWHVVVG
jgi:hypothetical protein